MGLVFRNRANLVSAVTAFDAAIRFLSDSSACFDREIPRKWNVVEIQREGCLSNDDFQSFFNCHVLFAAIPPFVRKERAFTFPSETTGHAYLVLLPCPSGS